MGRGREPNLVDVAAAGGWKVTQPLFNCYQHADRDDARSDVARPEGFGTLGYKLTTKQETKS